MCVCVCVCVCVCAHVGCAGRGGGGGGSLIGALREAAGEDDRDRGGVAPREEG